MRHIIIKYYYTGWQRAVLPATADVERAPELARVVKVYNELAEADGFPAANHFIMTHYIDGEHSIGFLFSAKSFSFPNYTNSRSFSGAAKAEVRK